MSVIVRGAVSSDLLDVVKLIRPMWVEHGKQESDFLREKYFRSYNARKHFSQWLKRDSDNHLFVAEKEGEIVGCTMGEEVTVN